MIVFRTCLHGDVSLSALLQRTIYLYDILRIVFQNFRKPKIMGLHLFPLTHHFLKQVIGRPIKKYILLFDPNVTWKRPCVILIPQSKRTGETVQAFYCPEFSFLSRISPRIQQMLFPDR